MSVASSWVGVLGFDLRVDVRRRHPLKVSFALTFGEGERRVQLPDQPETLYDPGLQLEGIVELSPGSQGRSSSVVPRPLCVFNESLARRLRDLLMLAHRLTSDALFTDLLECRREPVSPDAPCLQQPDNQRHEVVVPESLEAQQLPHMG